MVEINQRDSERLYLQKDGTKDIFIENSQLLKQHQIDGLRFLYIQFKKKKQGVIINFPPNCGKTVAVALFIFAVRNLLKKPVLILCADDDEICMWREYFLMWTEYNDDDLIIESPKVLKDKKIFIKKTDGLISYSSHSWSIVVLKDNNINPNIFQISDTEYKIWISSIDVKKDISMLASAYSWLHPKKKIDFKQFTSIGKNQEDIYTESVYFDSFLEDFVIREDNIKTFNSTNSITSNTVTNANNISRKSRKNKDATGTKIKRSKRTTDYNIPNNNEVAINNIRIDNVISLEDNVIKEIIVDGDKNRMRDEMSLNVLHTASNVMEVDSDSLKFANAIEDIVKTENNIQIKNSTESMDFDDDTKINKDISQIYEVNDHNEVQIDNINEINDVVLDEQCMELTENITNIENTDNILKRHNIDSKLTELEESTLKKFKGSLLDSLF